MASHNGLEAPDTGFPWLAGAMLAFEACEVIRIRLTMFATGGVAAGGEHGQTNADHFAGLEGEHGAREPGEAGIRRFKTIVRSHGVTRCCGSEGGDISGQLKSSTSTRMRFKF